MYSKYFQALLGPITGTAKVAFSVLIKPYGKNSFKTTAFDIITAEQQATAWPEKEDTFKKDSRANESRQECIHCLLERGQC